MEKLTKVYYNEFIGTKLYKIIEIWVWWKAKM